MITLNAYLYDGKSSARRAVVVKLTVPGYLVLQELGTLSRYRLDDLDIAPRLGDQPARVGLPGGAHLEVPDGAEFYRQLGGSGGRSQWLHALESRWSLVAGIVLVVALLGWLAYAEGIPRVAQAVAEALPPEIDQRLGEEGLDILDARGLQPSELDLPRQYELQVVMMDVVTTVGDPSRQSYRLVFRQGGPFGANALALPDGTIVLTDELVGLAEHDDEIAAVLAHEVGHVRNRHALRSLLQNSAVAAVVIWFTGDVSGLSGLAAGLPTVLAQAGYSREFETEADGIALEYLVARDIPMRRFADLLVRLDDGASAGALAGLLATHPRTPERLEALRMQR